MSTKAQIRVIGRDGTIVDLYHPYDGYFVGVGKHLQRILADTRNELKFLAALMDSGSDMEGYEIAYDLYDDVEYFYLVDFKTGQFKGWHLKRRSPWPKNASIDSMVLKPNIDTDSEPMILV